MPLVPTGPDRPDARRALRERLHAVRDRAAADVGDAAHAALGGRLREVLVELEPGRLGLYWPLRSEFNAAMACRADPRLQSLPLALPFVHKSPPAMHYRAWDGAPPTLRDERNIPTVDGAAVVPDVVVVPCLGYTDAGFRLGYGGGYFDRWLAAHPGVTTVGVAWSATRVDNGEFGPQPHDIPLTLIVTERDVVAG